MLPAPEAPCSLHCLFCASDARGPQNTSLAWTSRGSWLVGWSLCGMLWCESAAGVSLCPVKGVILGDACLSCVIALCQQAA